MTKINKKMSPKKTLVLLYHMRNKNESNEVPTLLNMAK